MNEPSLLELPLFPLPDAVLFPGQALPLHVFEPRYREMAAAALAGRRMLGVALLQRGYEDLYFTTEAPIHRVIGIGRIVDAQELPDGRFNMLLQGEVRARIDSEVPGQSFRIARVLPQVTEQDLHAAGVAQVRGELAQLLRCGAKRCGHGLFEEGVQLLDSSVDLETCVNLISSALPVAGDCRQRLLESDSLAGRAALLREAVRELVNASQDHLDLPPASMN